MSDHDFKAIRRYLDRTIEEVGDQRLVLEFNKEDGAKLRELKKLQLALCEIYDDFSPLWETK